MILLHALARQMVKGEVVYDEEAFVAKLSKAVDPEEATLLLFDS